jgi:RNA polymerase sigma-70 factor (ECF subfamily)
MNRTYALAMANSINEAIAEALKLDLKLNQYYYCLLAELYKLNGNNPKEKIYLNKALKIATKSNEKILIQEKLEEASK